MKFDWQATAGTAETTEEIEGSFGYLTELSQLHTQMLPSSKISVQLFRMFAPDSVLGNTFVDSTMFIPVLFYHSVLYRSTTAEKPKENPSNSKSCCCVSDCQKATDTQVAKISGFMLKLEVFQGCILIAAWSEDTLIMIGD